MAYFKNLVAESILEVPEDQVETYLEYSDRYALCDINGNLIEETETVKAELKEQSKKKETKAVAKKAEETEEAGEAPAEVEER